MAGLFDNLSSASRALVAARFGLEVAGQNIANVNTVGYSRRVAFFSDVPAPDFLSAGGGVSVLGAFAMRDRFVQDRLRRELMGGGFDAAVTAGLTEIEAALGLPGESIDGELTAFFDAFQTLADDPTSIPARDGVLGQARQLAQAFGSMNNRFTVTRRNADTAIAASVEEINHIAAEVARLNDQISDGGPDVETLRDRRDVAVSRLSELAGVTATTTADGHVDIAMGNGRALVVGITAYSVTATTSGPGGFTSMSLGGFDITSEVTGGTIGGLITLRDTTVPGYQTKLDQLAYDFATEVNTLHHGGFDAAGVAGGDFFVPLAGVAGAAALLAVDPALAANSQLVAASGTGAPGDNQTAQAIAQLRDARVINGGTATAIEAWGQLTYRIGADVASAESSSSLHDDVIRQLGQLRDQTSGVSMDEEAANLMRFQRSYEANARYFTTVVDTLDTLMNMVR